MCNERQLDLRLSPYGLRRLTSFCVEVNIVATDIGLDAPAERIVPQKPVRDGWYDGYQTQYDLDAWCNPATNEADMGDWEW